MHFTSHYSTPHHIKCFHITHHFITSRQTILHHTNFHVTFHTTPPLHIPHHITTYHTFHATSQTFDIATRLTSDHILHLTPHYTVVCPPPPFHATTSLSTTYSTSHSTIPHPQLFHTTPIHITARFTPHHIPHRITPHILILHHSTTSDIATHLTT